MHVIKSGTKRGPINQDAGSMINFCQGYCWWPLYLNMDGVEYYYIYLSLVGLSERLGSLPRLTHRIPPWRTPPWIIP